MNNIFPIPIFPQGVLSGSVITTVWVGVFVVAFFNLRLGWVLSGLVVPGYLVPLLIVKPIAAAVVLLEGVITYFLVWLFSDYLVRLKWWSSFFGRDRFFLILLFSIVVRVVMDGWLLPKIGAFTNNHLGIVFDYRNDLHSFGLIIVALIANQFHKPGLMRGFFQLIITVLLTYIIVRYVLTGLTNFNISNLNYVYSDIALSMLASPKTYIILVIAAFLSSRMNLFYGWEFNGILIPALLTLQWYQPTKILASFAESFIILGLANIVMRLPVFARSSIEGGRKLLLFFNIGFVYKIILGFALLYFLPHVKPLDFYAFGYVLSTLIAIKMHDKNIFVRLPSATIQVSIVSIVIASVIGYLFTFTPQINLLNDPYVNSNLRYYIYSEKEKLIDALRNEKVLLYTNKWKLFYKSPFPGEIDLFSNAMQMLAKLKATDDSPQLRKASELLSRIHFQIYTYEDRYFYIKERNSSRGWGIYVIDTKSDNNMLVEVPASLDEKDSIDVGVMLYLASKSKFLALSNSSQLLSKSVNANVLRSNRTIFQAFHKAVALQNVIQVRSYQSEETNYLPSNSPSKLWVKSSLPAGLDLKILKNSIGNIDIEWANSPTENIQRDATTSGFAELYLNSSDTRILLSKLMALHTDIPQLSNDEGVDGYLQQWILSTKDVIAGSGTNLYLPPKKDEILFFDQQVLVPLLAIMDQQYQDGKWSRIGLDELRIINNNAAQVGYQLIRYHSKRQHHDFLILCEKSDAKNYRGMVVFRLGKTNPFVIQIPRPLFEVNTFEYGVSLFETLKAKALVVAGANPNANVDKSADVISYQNKANFFNLISQVILRESKDQNMMVVQSRTFSITPDRPTPDADVLVAFDNGATKKDQLSVLGKLLVANLEHTGFKFSFVGGEPESAGYSVGNIFHARYLLQSKNKEFSIVWLSPISRLSFKQQIENKTQTEQFEAAHIKTVDADLTEVILGNKLGSSSDISKILKGKITDYLREEDVLLLRSITAEGSHYIFERLIDKNNKNAYLLIYNKDHTLLLIVNLTAIDLNRSVVVTDRKLTRNDVLHFMDSRAAWLILEKTE